MNEWPKMKTLQKFKFIMAKNQALHRMMTFQITLIITLIIVVLRCENGMALTLKEAIATALSLNPEIKNLDAQYESGLAKKRQTLAPNEPSLNFQYNDGLKFLKYQDAASYQMSITQPVLFPGKSLLAYKSADFNSRAIYYQMKAKILDVSNQVKAAYWGLALANRNLALNFDQRLTFERVAAVARRRYEAGAITQVDLLGAEIALYANANDLEDLNSMLRTARSQLNILLGKEMAIDEVVEDLKKTEIPTIAEIASLSRMLDQRAEIQAARATAESAHANYRLSQMSWLPDFQLSVGSTIYFNQSASPIYNTNPETNRTYFAGVSLTFPLWGLVNERQGMQAALSDQRASQYNLETVYNQSKLLYDSGLENLSILRKKISNYENHLIPLADQALNLALSAYSSGKLDFQTLSSTAGQKRSLMKDYFTQIYNFKLALSSYGQLLGEDL